MAAAAAELKQREEALQSATMRLDIMKRMLQSKDSELEDLQQTVKARMLACANVNMDNMFFTFIMARSVRQRRMRELVLKTHDVNLL